MSNDKFNNQDKQIVQILKEFDKEFETFSKKKLNNIH